MTAQKGVNIDRSREIGENIPDSMVGVSVEDCVFRKADQATTLGSRSTVKVKGKSVTVDPQLILQRLVTIGQCSVRVKYELCTHLPALLESDALPLQSNKATLADVLFKSRKGEQREPSANVQYVLSGDILLHCIPWPRGSTFDSVCQMYVAYVTHKCGAAVVVFDGYKDELATKDATQLRQTGACAGMTVHFDGDMMIQSKIS